MSVPAPSLDRRHLLADRGLRGRAFCRAHSRLVDRWLGALWSRAAGSAAGVALAAVGGYGRNELCPESDLDLILLHDGAVPVDEIAEALWYPIWDSGLRLGHTVATPEQTAESADDLETATALLACRLIAGDGRLVDRVGASAQRRWSAAADRWIDELARQVIERREVYGDVAFLLEPDLKLGHGGLRDIATLRWLDLARPSLGSREIETLARAEDRLVGARVALHRTTGRSANLLTLQDQDAVADDLEHADADALMGSLAGAARQVGWLLRTELDLVGAGRRPCRPTGDELPPLPAGVQLVGGHVSLSAPVDSVHAPRMLLDAAAAAALRGVSIDQRSCELFAEHCPPFPARWPTELRAGFVALLASGRGLIEVVESLDHWGLFERAVPEWLLVRSKPQRNAYHRFTVDRHLCEAAANAGALAATLDRPDLAVVGAFFHDIGKGLPGDHTDVGIELVHEMASRMGFSPPDVDLLVDMVRHHLLLSDVATRRDLSDATTIESVARAVGSVELLDLLHVLTEADSIATGPSAWSEWKAQLVSELVAKVRGRLRGIGAEALTAGRLPSARQRELLSSSEDVVTLEGGTLTVVSQDRPGVFSRLAGVLALCGCEVLEATAHSTEARALSEFAVVPLFGDEIDTARVERMVRAALGGRLAVRARLAARAEEYRRKTTAATPSVVDRAVLFDNDASATATVIEVRAPDAVGLLYRITMALAELDLDIRSAKVQTLGSDVVDSFYVRTLSGGKIEDVAHRDEVEHAISHALDDWQRPEVRR